MLKKLLLRVWNSPTLMTWMSYSTKALSLFVVLPLILSKFSVEEITLWYLFSSIMVLLSIADMGFRYTFARIISFALGGATNIDDFKSVKKSDNDDKKLESNWKLIEVIFSYMKIIYKRLSIVLFVLLLSVGTLFLIKPISNVTDQNVMWLAWGIIIFGSTIRFYGVIYQNYLEGLNEIALIRRIEAFMNLGLIINSIAVLLLGYGLLGMVICFQIWAILNVIRNWYLARQVGHKRFRSFTSKPFELHFFKKIWKRAWRSGLSGIMSNGLTQMSGVLYAQIGSTELVAAYLLALRIITQIKEVSMAPFYSKLPLIARYRTIVDIDKIVKLSKRGMLFSHFTFVIGVVFIDLMASHLLSFIDSETTFVEQNLWFLLSLAFFVHRYGAMHIQLYTTTNHVISHIADGVSGLLFILVGFLLVNELGVYAIPIGMLTGYLGFYAWYAAKYSLSSISISFFRFERYASFLPFLLLVSYILFSMYLN